MSITSFFEIDLDRKDYSISDLLSFLKSSFRLTDFEKVEQLLKLREEKIRLNGEADKLEFEGKFKALSKKMEKRDLEFKMNLKSLENELGLCRDRCVELEERSQKAQVDSRVLLEKKGREDREAREDFTELKSKFNELSAEKVGVDEELNKYKRMYGEFEAKIANLLENARKKEQEEKEKCVRPMRDTGKLERRVEIEYSNKSGELEARVLHLEEEQDLLPSGRGRLSHKKINLGPEDVRSSRTQNKVKNCARGSEKSTEVKDEKIDDCLVIEDYGNRDRNHFPFGIEGRSGRRVTSSTIIEIVDSDDEMGLQKSFKRMRSD